MWMFGIFPDLVENVSMLTFANEYQTKSTAEADGNAIRFEGIIVMNQRIGHPKIDALMIRR